MCQGSRLLSAAPTSPCLFNTPLILPFSAIRPPIFPRQSALPAPLSPCIRPPRPHRQSGRPCDSGLGDRVPSRLILGEERCLILFKSLAFELMRKEQSKVAAAEGLPSQVEGQESALQERSQIPLRISRQIHKRKGKGTRKAKLSTAATAQMLSSEQTLPSQKHVPSTQKPQPSASRPLVIGSFELHNLMPSAPQAQAPVSGQLRQIWGYIGDIGEHLLNQETRLPRAPLNYSVYFGPAQRLRGITLICNHSVGLGLRTETKFLALDIFHRICTAPDFERYHSALKAAASLYMACKYEEKSLLAARVFSYLDPLQPVAPENILKLEGKILLHFDFNLGFALPVHFAELLALRFELDAPSRQTLLHCCLQGMCNEQLWLGGGSLLAMASMWVVSGPAPSWEQSPLAEDLRWRVSVLQGLLQA